MQAGYPSSWYAVTAGAHEGCAPLSGDQTADVCIIGGGFTGVSAALSLAEAGKSVVLLEARKIGWGASGRNGGQLIRGFVGQERMAAYWADNDWGVDRARGVGALTWAGHDLIRRRIDEYEIDCNLTPGWLEVATTPNQLTALYHHYNEMETLYPDRGWHFLGADELKAAIGSDRYLGGMLSMSDGHLHPLKLCLGLAKGALGKGVRLYEQSAVTDIEESARVCVRTAAGKVTADQLIIAANAHHRLGLPGLHGFAAPAGSYIIATEVLGGEVLSTLNRDRYAICDTKKVCDYFRISDDGRVLFGGRVNFSGAKPKSIEAALMPRLLKVWPQLEGVKVDYAWGGRLGVSLGEVPLIGALSDKTFYGYGYTGHGVNMGNLAGDILADAVLGDKARFDLFAHMPKRRLPFGQYGCMRWLGQKAVSAAILYYWLRDRL